MIKKNYNPKISIIIPIYNAESTIIKCLDSIQNQTYDHLEIICVDDCSDDSSICIIKEKMKEDDRIVLLENSKNSGTLITRKNGVLRASGEYILFADNDDWYELNACEILVEEINKEPSDIIMYSFNPIDQSKKPNLFELKQLVDLGTAIPECIYSNNCIFINNRMNLLWNKLISADICKQAYSYVEDMYMTIGEDTYACWLIHYFAKSFRSIPFVLYNWNVTTGISTKKKYSKNEFDRYCESMSGYERGVATFLQRIQATDDIIDEFDRGNLQRVETCIHICVTCVDTDDFAKAFNSIIKYFGAERVLSNLQSSYNRNNNKINSQSKTIKRLKKEINKIESSNSYKIGRVLTKPWRIVRRKK